MNPTVLEHALAMLIANTRTKSRSASLLDIAGAVKVARDHLGSLRAVGERIALSGKMLGQFLMVEKLSDSVKSHVGSRKIDSVDAVAHLSQLMPEDQEEVANRLINDHWATEDIRVYKEARHVDQITSPKDLADKVAKSRSSKHYVFEFVVRGNLDESTARMRLQPWLPEQSILLLNIIGSRGELTVNDNGHDALRHEAKNRHIPLRSILSVLIYS